MLIERLALERKAILEASLPQTGQWSDPKDARCGILGDLFFNLADFHRTFRKPNDYGPVLFVVDPKSLLEILKGRAGIVSITRTPPHERKDAKSFPICFILPLTLAEKQVGPLDLWTKKPMASMAIQIRGNAI